MKKFELMKFTKEIAKKESIVECCTRSDDGRGIDCVTLIKSFDYKDEAFAELENFKTEIIQLSGAAGAYYMVTEYFVEENEYDEDGEWINGGDVWAYSQMTKEGEA